MNRTSPSTRKAIAVAAVLAVVAVFRLAPAPRSNERSTPFAQQIAALSEPGGYFDTDNLISNESSYLQVLPDLRRNGVAGGAYLGVGPDQNFTYIAAVRPALAVIVDIRRDNLLLHLLFKALFQLSPTRVEYLAQLFGRPVPGDLEGWRSSPIDRLVDYVDRTPPAGGDALRARVDGAIARFGVPLSSDDRRTIDRFHRRFIDSGLSLQFQSTGRPPRRTYPTYRDLLLDRDPSGRQSNFLASHDSFQFVRSLQARDLVIPVVGDFAGPSALDRVGRLLATRKEPLSAFYTSNVEGYLFRAGTFPRFLANLAKIPQAKEAVVIRSIFRPYASPSRGRDESESRLQRLDELMAAAAAGRIREYADVIGR